MYPAELVAPMKKDLTDAGFSELITPQEVDNTLTAKEGTLLVMVNSVCGCAAGAARPGVKMALQQSDKKPSKLATVFAGVDSAAVDRARQYMLPYPPSSPSIGLFKDGKLVHFIERHHIEGRSADMIAAHLKAAFEEYC
jgi:putative YphP/YqiW family bacilliredoxin